MNTKNKLLAAAAALLLAGTYLLPLWSIGLEAPQYPEGLGMHIWLNTVTGENPNDLNTINGLNHYIGMQAITPESIPELRVMPWVMGFFLLTGLAIAAAGMRRLIPVWLLLLIAAGAVGLYDFYTWGYDYGHNLNPNAPIKVPGMSYQPPLLGTKQLLNITATSLPGAGSLLIGASLLLMAYAWYSSGSKHHAA